MELNERKQKILTAVIDAYIKTGEPVGSKAVMDMLDNAVSSATIRNEMAELDYLGFLEQPHTSAGRVPTAIAFRLYIDRLMRRRNLSTEDCRRIDGMLKNASGDPEQLMGEATQALAQTTGCAAVTTTPSGQSAEVRRIEVLRVTSRSAALLLMTSSGMLRSRVCRFDRNISGDTLSCLAKALSASFNGCILSDIGLPQVQSLMAALGENGLLCAPALTAFYQLVQESADAEVLLTGQLNLLGHPDYEPARARDLLNFLARRELLSDMLTSLPMGLRVMFGSESKRPELNGSSIIVTHYTLGGHPDGTIGIIGPLRMNYADTIPRLEYFAKAIGRILDEITGDHDKD